MCCGGSCDSQAIVLGGMRGLGLAISKELFMQSHAIQPIRIGRSAEDRGWDINIDLRNPETAAKKISERLPILGDATIKTFYWVAGEYHRGPFADQKLEKTASMTAVHFLGPLAVLRAFHNFKKHDRTPYNLVIIGSVFVHKPGKNHAVLAALKAAKANFARVFSYELAKDLPGSKTLLVNPWAMKTNFFDGYEMDPKMVEKFMDPQEVARIILEEEKNLSKDVKTPIVEITLDRDENGAIKKLIGPQPVKY